MGGGVGALQLCMVHPVAQGVDSKEVTVLPPISRDPRGEGVLASLLSGVLLRHPWRHKPLEPVLKAQQAALEAATGAAEGRLLAPLGGPPRRKGRAVFPCLVTSVNADDFSATSVIPRPEDAPPPRRRRCGCESNCGSCWSETSPRRPRPPRPRMALRREMWSAASNNSTSSYAASSSADGYGLLPSIAKAPRPPSPSVAEALHTRDYMGKEPGFFRNSLDEEVESRVAQWRELATHRADSLKARGYSDRQQAKLWREQHHKKTLALERKWRTEHEILVLKTSQDLAKAAPKEAAPKEVEESLLASLTQAAPPTQSAAEEGLSASPADDSEQGSSSSRPGAGPAKVGLLRKTGVHLKHSKEERTRALNEQRRLKKLSELGLDSGAAPTKVLKRAFGESWKEHRGRRFSVEVQSVYRSKELETFRRVFDKYDRDNMDCLDQSELRSCLGDLGLRAKNEAEREAIREVIRSVASLDITFDELVLRIVPEVRQRLAQLTDNGLKKLFEEADEDRSGTLSIGELVAILRRMGTFPGQKQVEDAVLEVMPGAASQLYLIDGQICTTKNILEMEHFRKLVHVLQERCEAERQRQGVLIAQAAGLTEEQQDIWKVDLVDLHEAFVRLCDRGSETLLSSQLQLLVREVGMLSGRKGLKETLKVLARAEVEDDMDPWLEFKQVVRILTKLRLQETDRLREIFSSRDRLKTGGLSLKEVQLALQDCEIRARDQEEALEIAGFIEEFDEDDCGEMDLAEFMHLVYFVVDRLKKQRREKEQLLVYKFGWPEFFYQDCRSVFLAYDEDMSGRLDAAEVAKAVMHMRQHWPPHATMDLIIELGLPHELDLMHFLHLLRAMEEREENRKLALATGLDKESADAFCARWRSLDTDFAGKVPKERLRELLENIQPGHGDRVQDRWAARGSKLRVRHLNSVLQQVEDEVKFSTFLDVIRRLEMATDAGEA